MVMKMNFKEIEYEFSILPNNYKTKDVDRLNKRLIKEKKDVSILKDYVLSNDKYHRTYFQVSLGLIKDYKDKMKFI